ncbi:MAG: alpha/beta fold hydrolase, partial [Paracoccaceae bacterium]
KGEAVPDKPPQNDKSETSEAPHVPSLISTPEHTTEIPTTTQKTRATPAARKLAQDAGLSVADIQGTGPRDRVQSGDVRASIQTVSPSIAPAGITWDTATAPLNIVRTGAGDATPQLLIHGLGADANAWAQIEKSIAAKGPVLRLELPCHGKSPRLQVESFAHLVTHIRAAFDALNMNTVRLVGHSLGAALALALADTRPRNVERLTLISPAGLGPQINGDILSGIARATNKQSLGPWLRQMVGDPSLITDNYVQAVMTARKDPDMRSAQTTLQNTLFADHTQGFDLTAALHRLTCPTRIIFGKKDQVIPWSHALRAPGHVSLNLFEDLGHMPQFEAPNAVQAHL